MFQTIKDNFAMAVIALLTIAVIVSGAMWAVTAGQLSAANTSLTNEIAAKAVIQTDLDNATVQLKAAEVEKERLRLDAALTAKTLTVREQGRDAVDSELVSTQTKAKAVIEDSTDDIVKAWAVASVPVELNRLLEYSANCAHGDSNANGLCTASAGTHERMRDPQVHGPNKPATF
ncbi:hypothetical protein H9J30_11885 [Shewanella sp. PS-2]|uniref:Uncharacterized protein n=1 Tax=Shewanella cutis TaxID=2766780 RepID=A0ABS9QWA5_9GAMM|nr:hypothetical protein [Shewanella sp. PS-2]MCG9964611.1 hypothetical protein [Shewanella sp. PS-2]